MGGIHSTCGNSRGVGDYFCVKKLEIPGRRGALREIPSVVGVWIFFGTTHYEKHVLSLNLVLICVWKSNVQISLIVQLLFGLILFHCKVNQNMTKPRVPNKFWSRRLEKQVPQARASRKVWGHAPPEKFQNLEGQIYFHQET